MKPAIIVIDMLKDFVRGSLKADSAQRIVDPLRRLLNGARVAGIPVIFANDVSITGVDHKSSVRGSQAISDARAAQIIDELEPSEEDYQVPKYQHSAFRGSNLHLLLKDLGVDTVVLCGLHTNICVASTAGDAFRYGYRIIVPPDGVEAFTEDEQLMGLDRLERLYGAELIGVDRLLDRVADMKVMESHESSDRRERNVWVARV